MQAVLLLAVPWSGAPGWPDQTQKRECFICRAEQHHNAWWALHTGKSIDWPLFSTSQMTVGDIMGAGHSHCELCQEWKIGRSRPQHITVNGPSHLSIY
jgi:hypothetical protein